MYLYRWCWISLEENISTNNAGLRGVNKDGLDSYFFPERDKIDGKMVN